MTLGPKKRKKKFKKIRNWKLYSYYQKERKKDAEIGTEEEETKHEFSPKTQSIKVVTPKEVPETTDTLQNKSNIENTTKQLNVLQSESIMMSPEKITEEVAISKPIDLNPPAILEPNISISEKQNNEKQVHMDISKSSNLEMNYTPSFKTKSEKMLDKM